MQGDREFMFILDKVKRNRNIDFRQYRPAVLKNRVQNRLHATKCGNYWDYIMLLNREPEEYDRLIESLTIKVSQFFRNPEVFEFLGNEIIPEIISRNEAGGSRKIRAWSCGSAFGEEAYSLAILFCEALGKRATDSRVNVLATDIDGKVIKEAPWGSYDRKALGEMKAHILFKYFSRVRDRYVVADVPRSLVSFKRHDIVGESPMSGMNLVLCRNLLIYFEEELKEKVFHNLYGALSPGGFLVLGKVEGINNQLEEHFEVVNMRERVYRKSEK